MTRIRGFGPAEIVARDPYVEQTIADLYGVRMVAFEELLERADYITIHCAATSETTHMFDSNALGKPKPTALLVNTARGPIIDGTALAGARSGANRVERVWSLVGRDDKTSKDVRDLARGLHVRLRDDVFEAAWDHAEEARSHS